MTHLTPGQLAAAAQPMEPTQVRDAFVRAHIDGEADAPEGGSGYASVRHGLARVIPLVLAEERARAADELARLRAALADAEETVLRIARAKAHTTADNRQFVYVDEIAEALGLPAGEVR